MMGNKVFKFIGLVVATIVVLYIFFTQVKQWREINLNETGITEGYVVAKSDYNSEGLRFAIYSIKYFVSDKEYTLNWKVSAIFSNYAIGDEIEVIYQKNNPKISDVNCWWLINGGLIVSSIVLLGVVGYFVKMLI